MARDYFHGKGKPTSNYMGVSALYARKDGTIIWRAHIILPNSKLHVIGTYESEKEAAEAYDNYIKEYKLLKPLNENEYRTQLTEEDKQFIDSMFGVISNKALADITKKTITCIKNYTKGKEKQKGDYSVIVLDKRDKYEE